MKKKNLLKAALIVGMGVGAFAVDSEAADAAQLYRAYNPNTGEHLYTANGNEIPFVVKNGWKDEGNAWEVPDKGVPVYRVFNPNNGGDHHYTLNYNEVKNLIGHGWKDEGIAWNSGGSIPVHRLYNPNAKTGTHHFTIDANEKDVLVQAGWKYEGVAMYGGGAGSANDNVQVGKIEQEIAQKTLAKINNHRGSLGIRKLDNSSVLDGAAKTRANDMYSRYDHTRPDGTSFDKFINEQVGYNKYGYAVGENIIAITYKSDRDNSEGISNLIFENWKKSSGHRATMESVQANEGSVGVKMQHTGSTYYDVAVVFVTGKNNSK